MKTFEEFDFDVIDAQVFRKKFLELSHLDEIEIKFDLLEYENMLFYFYNQTCLFYNTKKINSEYIYINYEDVWGKFIGIYDNQYIKDNIKIILKDYFTSLTNIELDWRKHLGDINEYFYI